MKRIGTVPSFVTLSISISTDPPGARAAQVAQQPPAKPTDATVPAAASSANSTAPAAAREAPAATKPAISAPNGTAAETSAPGKVVSDFKSFVSNEKERLTARKQNIAKKEKDTKLSELLRFSQTFKVSYLYNLPLRTDIDKPSSIIRFHLIWYPYWRKTRRSRRKLSPKLPPLKTGPLPQNFLRQLLQLIRPPLAPVKRPRPPSPSEFTWKSPKFRLSILTRAGQLPRPRRMQTLPLVLLLLLQEWRRSLQFRRRSLRLRQRSILPHRPLSSDPIPMRSPLLRALPRPPPTLRLPVVSLSNLHLPRIPTLEIKRLVKARPRCK